MRKALYLLALPLLMACGDYIAEDDRYIELPPIEAKRNVLIEDFTGQKCSNCPDAHQVINDLKLLYGDHVVAVAIHAGNFGIPEDNESGTVGLMQPDGDDYAAYWKVAAYPTGIINRTSGLLKHTDWAVYSRQALMTEPQVAIGVNAEITDNNIVIHTELSAETALKAKLQLWITESDITAEQQNGKTNSPNYLHNHVYRASVNTLWGEDITLADNTPTTYEHSIALRDNWDADNLSVVAFVYNDNDGVLQVTEHHINR